MSTIEAPTPDLIPVQVNVEQLRAALRDNHELWLHFLLGEELTYPVPDFHIELFHYMMDDQHQEPFVGAIPRGHAKTTLARAAALKYLLYTKYRYVLYTSATHALAVPSTNVIYGWLRSPNVEAVFGKITPIIERDGAGLYVFLMPDGTQKIIKAHGAGQRMRGTNIDNARPELGIADDIEDPEFHDSREAHTKLKRWWYGTYLKAFSRKRQKIIQLGNLTVSKSLLALHLGMSDTWITYLRGCILADGNPLWPDLWPLEAIKKDFREYQQAGETATWFAEMMNIPIPTGKRLIQPETITYRPAREPDQVKYAFLTVDLALSDKTWADLTVVVVHAFIEEEGLWQVVEYDTWRGVDPKDLFYHCIRLMIKWRAPYCGIENTAFQAVLKKVFAYWAMDEALAWPQFVPLEAVGNKTQRIAVWAAELTSPTEDSTNISPPTYALTEGDFLMTQQLLTYDPLKRDNDDDAIDAGAYGVQMRNEYLYDIINATTPDANQQVALDCYAISPV